MACRWLPSCSHGRQGDSKLSAVPSSKGTNPILEAPSSWPQVTLVSMAPPPNTNMFRDSAATRESGVTAPAVADILALTPAFPLDSEESISTFLKLVSRRLLSPSENPCLTSDAFTSKAAGVEEDRRTEAPWGPLWAVAFAATPGGRPWDSIHWPSPEVSSVAHCQPQPSGVKKRAGWLPAGSC